MGKRRNILKAVSNKKKECHILVNVEGNQEEFNYIVKEIRNMVRKHNHISERRISFEISKSYFEK